MVKQQVLELLSPISHHHPASFVAAVAAAWHERRLRGQPKQVSSRPTLTAALSLL